MKENKTKPDIRFKGFTEAWEQRKLGEVVEFYNGDRSSRYPTDSDIVPDGIPFINAGDLVSGRVKLDTANKITKEKYNELSGAKIQRGDIIYCLRGTLGKNAFIDNFDSGTVASSLVDIRPKKIVGKYLFQVLNSDIEYRQRTINDEGAAQPNLSAKNLSLFDIPMSNKDEQTKIAEYFSNLDNLITLHQRECDQLKELKKSMLKKMFPRDESSIPEVRFAGFTDAWEQRKFVRVFDGLQNNTLSRADLNYEGGTVKNVHYGDVLIKFGDYIDASKTELPYISDSTKADKFKSSFLQDGDIIIADTAEDDTVGKCTEIQGSEGLKLLSGLHTVACRPKEKYGQMFLGYYINSPAYHNQLKPLMQGIKVTSISKSALQDTDMIMPKSIDEQIRIGEYFSTLDNLITLHQRELEILKNLKKTCLKRMFI